MGVIPSVPISFHTLSSLGRMILLPHLPRSTDPHSSKDRGPKRDYVPDLPSFGLLHGGGLRNTSKQRTTFRPKTVVYGKKRLPGRKGGTGGKESGSGPGRVSMEPPRPVFAPQVVPVPDTGRQNVVPPTDPSASPFRPQDPGETEFREPTREPVRTPRVRSRVDQRPTSSH